MPVKGERKMKKLILVMALINIWLLSCPASSEAQRVYRIGALVADDLFVPAFEAFREKMTEIGYIEGKNIRYDFNNAKGDRETVAKMAKKIVESKPDMIVTSSTTATLPVAKLTEGTNLPVVFLSSANPLALVKSYASSGNNLTGVSSSSLDIIGKQVELLKELMPRAKRIISLAYSGATNYEQVRRRTNEAANKLGLTVVELIADKPGEIKSKLTVLIERRAGEALFYSLNVEVISMREDIIRQATRARIPVIGTGIEAVQQGALASYTSDYFFLGAQGAVLVDKILKGARPSDLPIDQPSKLKLVINLKAAKVLGLKIPKEIILRADELIE